MVGKSRLQLALAMLFPLALNAQVTGDTSVLENVDVFTNYKPDVAESIKIDIQPALEDPKVEPPTYTYRFPNIAYQPKAIYSAIDPVFLKPEQEEDLYDNYIEIGGGNYLTSYVDANIFNTRDKYYTYGLQLKHHAANNSNNPVNGLFSQNRIRAFGERERGGRLKGVVDYQRNVVHYYGYTDTLNPYHDTSELKLGDINQIYNDVSANVIWSSRKGRKATSNLGLGFNIFDKLGENESTFTLDNNNEFSLGRGDFLLDVGATFTQLTETAKYNRLFIDILPHYRFRANRYDLDIGLNVNYFLDSNTNLPFFAPFAKVETYLVPDKLRMTAGLTGGLVKNTLRSISYQNLFLGDSIQYANSQEVYNAFIGMNGNFKRFIEYGISIGNKQTRDQLLFVNDTNALGNMVAISDDVTTTTFAGELKVDVSDNVDIGFRGSFYSYSLSSEAEAWHLPTYDVAAFSTVRFSDKIYVRAGYFGASTRTSRNINGDQFNLRAIHDLNIGAEYRYKKNISGFININNLLNQRYPIWNFHKSQGLNVLAGVTISL